MPPHKVAVKTPATTANLGPGFDCLGIALELFNTTTVERARDFKLTVTGEGEHSLSLGKDNLVYRAIALFYQHLGEAVPPLHVTCHNEIPLSRGLGSSAAAVVGGLLAANLLEQERLAMQGLLELAVSLEGHPDNVVPALLGGCQVVVKDENGLVMAPVPLARELRAVLYIPDFEMPTQKARAVLPKEVSRADAVFNIGRAALLVAALSTGRHEYLRTATEDRLHQPARRSLFHAMKVIFRAALDAGALGVFLSGAGSTVLALAQGREMTIAWEMADAAEKAGVPGRTLILHPSPVGAHAMEIA